MKSKQHHRKVIKANKYLKWKHESIKKRFNHHRIIIQKERDDEGEEKEVKNMNYNVDACTLMLGNRVRTNINSRVVENFEIVSLNFSPMFYSFIHE
jgi:hypothetical protein